MPQPIPMAVITVLAADNLSAVVSELGAKLPLTWKADTTVMTTITASTTGIVQRSNSLMALKPHAVMTT